MIPLIIAQVLIVFTEVSNRDEREFMCSELLPSQKNTVQVDTTRHTMQPSCGLLTMLFRVY